EGDRASRRGVVGVRDATRTVRSFERVIVTDDRRANGLDQACARGMHSDPITRPRDTSLRRTKSAGRWRHLRAGERGRREHLDEARSAAAAPATAAAALVIGRLAIALGRRIASAAVAGIAAGVAAAAARAGRRRIVAV